MILAEAKSHLPMPIPTNCVRELNEQKKICGLRGSNAFDNRCVFRGGDKNGFAHFMDFKLGNGSESFANGTRYGRRRGVYGSASAPQCSATRPCWPRRVGAAAFMLKREAEQEIAQIARLADRSGLGQPASRSRRLAGPKTTHPGRQRKHSVKTAACTSFWHPSTLFADPSEGIRLLREALRRRPNDYWRTGNGARPVGMTANSWKPRSPFAL